MTTLSELKSLEFEFQIVNSALAEEGEIAEELAKQIKEQAQRVTDLQARKEELKKAIEELSKRF